MSDSSGAGPPNPYVGPRAFETGEHLYGRDAEQLVLLDLLTAERIVLLHSPSGAGKTSLIQAGLIPRLQQEGFQVLPVIRVGYGASLIDTAAAHIANRYIRSTVLSLDPVLPLEQSHNASESREFSLDTYLDQRTNRLAKQPHEVLIFDQFEEILSVDPTDLLAKKRFFIELGRALDTRRRWALFAMREEFVASLAPYLPFVPTRLNTTFRLDLLSADAAMRAIQEPVRVLGDTFDVTDEAALKLIDDLRQIRVQQIGGTIETKLGPYIEPVQLQVVCQRLWSNPRGDPGRIVLADVEAAKSVDNALSDYYQDQVTAVARDYHLDERAIRDWFDKQLITDQGIRGQVIQSPGQSHGLDNRAIMALVNAHLLRVEERRGATWFELAHDRLIDPIRQNNATWREANLSQLQRQATLWVDQHRPDDLLLRGQGLSDGESWASLHTLTPDEEEFLGASREARDSTLREQRANRRIRRLLWCALAGGVIALCAAIAAIYVTSIAVAQQRAALVQALITEAHYQVGAGNDDTAALLSRQAYNLFQSYPSPILNQVDASLRDVLSTPYFNTVLHGHHDRVAAVAFSPDGRWLASGSLDGSVHLWSRRRLRQQPAVLSGPTLWVSSMAFSPDGHTLVVGSLDGRVRLWDTRHPGAGAMLLPGQQDKVLSLAVSADGRFVAAGALDGTVAVWRLHRQSAYLWHTFHQSYVYRSHHVASRVMALTFSPGGHILAATIADGTIVLRDLDDLQAGGKVLAIPPRQPPLFAEEVLSLVFSPMVYRAQAADPGVLCLDPAGESSYYALAAGSTYSNIYLWLLPRKPTRCAALGPTTLPNSTLPIHNGELEAEAFSPDGQWLAAGSSDGAVRLWQLPAQLTDISPIVKQSTELLGHKGDVLSVAFSADSHTLASGSGDQTIRLWDVSPNAGFDPIVLARTGTISTSLDERLYHGITSLAYSPDGHQLVAGDYPGYLYSWNTSRLGAPSHGPPIQGGIKAIAISRSGLRAVVGYEQPNIWLIDPAHGGRGRALAFPCGSSVAFSPNGQTLATGGCTGASLWNVQQAQPTPILLRDTAGVNTLAFSPNGRMLALGNGNQTVSLWRLGASPRLMATLLGHHDAVTALTFSNDGHTLASGSKDGAIRLWDTSHPQAASRVLFTSTAAIEALAFSPDGHTLASGGDDAMIRLWDVRSPTAAAITLSGHDNAVVALAFSPDGSVLASADAASSDNGALAANDQVRLWTVRTDDLAKSVCARVPRDLTPDEWDQFIGARMKTSWGLFQGSVGDGILDTLGIGLPYTSRYNVKCSESPSAAPVSSTAPTTRLTSPAPISPSIGWLAHRDQFGSWIATLRWLAVPGATKYLVEVNYGPQPRLGCLPSYVGNYRYQNILTTRFSINFIGVHPVNWRVSAVDASGRLGLPSAWLPFIYANVGTNTGGSAVPCQ